MQRQSLQRHISIFTLDLILKMRVVQIASVFSITHRTFAPEMSKFAKSITGSRGDVFVVTTSKPVDNL